MYRKICNALFSLVFALAIGQSAKGQVIIQTNVPPTSDTISVCLDTFHVSVLIINDTTTTIDSIFVTHIFPAGIQFTQIDFIQNAGAFDVSDSTKPVFLTDSLMQGDTIQIVLSAFVGCDFVDSYNNKNLPI